jgi:hypothetical protein
MARDWQADLKELVQPHCDEEVTVVGVLQPGGTMGAFGLGYVSGIASMVGRAKANRRAAGLAKTGMFTTKQAMIALSPSKMYAFNAALKKMGVGFNIKEQVGVWDRRDLKVTMEDKRITKAVMFEVTSTGERFELEAMTVAERGFHDPFFAEIAKHT